MPATQTITAHYTFVASEKAYFNRFNTNFSNMMGHSIPINPNIPSAIDNTYDLGSSSYRWNNSYLRTVYFRALTTTAQVAFGYDSANSTGAYSIKIGGTERYNMSSSLSVWNLATSTGEYIFKIGGTEYAKIDSNGLDIKSRWHQAFTTTAISGNIGRSAQVNQTYSTTGGTAINVTGSTCTVTTNGKRPIFIGVINATITNFLVTGTGSSPGVAQRSFNVILRRGGGNIAQAPFDQDWSLGNPDLSGYEFPSNFFTLEFLAAGTYAYHLAVIASQTTTSDVSVRGRVIAFQLT